MKQEVIPSYEELLHHKERVADIDPLSVITMLELRAAGEEVQHSILDILQREYKLSEGKFIALVILHQTDEGLAPSDIARRTGLAKATVSVLLQNLDREGRIEIRPDAGDGRGKIVRLTKEGRAWLDTILPAHYERISRLMTNLTQEEQEELCRLLRKLAAGRADSPRK